MPSTPNPACPQCGLRFGNKPLLDLHIREDHRQRVRRTQDGHPGRRAPTAQRPAEGVACPRVTVSPAAPVPRASRGKPEDVPPQNALTTRFASSAGPASPFETTPPGALSSPPMELSAITT
jgi:hypothetical protein